MLTWARSQETLEYLIDETQVITCKKTMREAIDYGEIALSAKILARGWVSLPLQRRVNILTFLSKQNIGSLAVAYRGWDFRVQRTCNGNRVCVPSRAVPAGNRSLINWLSSGSQLGGLVLWDVAGRT